MTDQPAHSTRPYAPSVAHVWVHPLHGRGHDRANNGHVHRPFTLGEMRGAPASSAHRHDWYPSRRAVVAALPRFHAPALMPPLHRALHRHITDEHHWPSAMHAPPLHPLDPAVARELAAAVKQLRRSLSSVRAHQIRNRTAWTVLAATLLVMIGAMVAMALWRPTKDVWVVNSLDHAVKVTFGPDIVFNVGPHAVRRKDMLAGEYEVVAFGPDGREFARETVVVRPDREYSGYNVLGAATLFVQRHNYRNPFDDVEKPLPGTWASTERADYFFEPVPSKVQAFASGDIIRFQVGSYPEVPDWSVTWKLLKISDRVRATGLLMQVTLLAPTHDAVRDSRAVEDVARCHGRKRGLEFLAQLEQRRDVPRAWHDEMVDLLERLVMGGAANEESGGDPAKDAWIELEPEKK